MWAPTLFIAAAVGTAVGYRYRRTPPFFAIYLISTVVRIWLRKRLLRVASVGAPSSLDVVSEGAISSIRFLLAADYEKIGARTALQTQLGCMLGRSEGCNFYRVTASPSAKRGAVDGYWLVADAKDVPTKRSDLDDKVVLFYSHGGGFVINNALYGFHMHALTIKKFNQLAERTGKRLIIFSVEYPLSPKSQFPGAIDTVVDAYRWLIEDVGVRKNLVVGGDSAGGYLAISLLNRIRDTPELASLPVKVSASVLHCPWVDLTGDIAAKEDAKKIYDVLSPGLLLYWAKCFAGPIPLGDPRISLVNSKEIATAKKTMVIIGGAEVFRASIEKFVERLPADTEVHVGKDMPHDYHNQSRGIPSIIPSALLSSPPALCTRVAWIWTGTVVRLGDNGFRDTGASTTPAANGGRLATSFSEARSSSTGKSTAARGRMAVTMFGVTSPQRQLIMDAIEKATVERALTTTSTRALEIFWDRRRLFARDAACSRLEKAFPGLKSHVDRFEGSVGAELAHIADMDDLRLSYEPSDVIKSRTVDTGLDLIRTKSYLETFVRRVETLPGHPLHGDAVAVAHTINNQLRTAKALTDMDKTMRRESLRAVLEAAGAELRQDSGFAKDYVEGNTLASPDEVAGILLLTRALFDRGSHRAWKSLSKPLERQLAARYYAPSLHGGPSHDGRSWVELARRMIVEPEFEASVIRVIGKGYVGTRMPKPRRVQEGVIGGADATIHGSGSGRFERAKHVEEREGFEEKEDSDDGLG
ncbi:hypothetical protein HK101_007624 [Irineochytrium annulatum]|nr:hypothetical protein HK101_007624 [Irineochytrium annulatum]